MSTQRPEITPPFGSDGLSDLIDGSRRQPTEWTEPDLYNLAHNNDRCQVVSLFQEGKVTGVHDAISEVADELFEYEQPSQKDNDIARTACVERVQSLGETFGTWVHFPWSGQMVRYPDKKQHRALRTSRNRNLVTDQEQAMLYEAKVAVFGLSVGSNIVEKLALSGIGGTIIMGDPDRISPSNLNRITGSFSDVGTKKLDHMAKKVSEIDPYIEQVHLPDGFTPDAKDTLVAHLPDVIFDEVDSLPAKAQLRQFAKERGIPLIMVTDLGDRSIVDIERHDLDDVQPFNGRVKQAVFEELLQGNLPADEKMKLMTRIVGFRHVTTRMLESVVKIDEEIAGMPQLGVTASIGAGIGTIAAREIILDRKMNTGRYVFSPKSTLELQPQGTVRQYIRALKSLLKRSK